MKTTLMTATAPRTLTVQEMKDGDIGYVTIGGTEMLMMRTPAGVVNLNAAYQFWTLDYAGPMDVILLPKGCVVQLEVE
jgi:hypothetical protein